MVIELIEMFPERIGTAEMHKAGIRLGKTAPAWLYEKLEEQLSGNYNLPDIENPRLAKVEKWEKLLQLCKETALSRNKDTGEYRHYAPSMEDFLIDLCINPRVSFTLPGEKSNWSQFESARAMDEYRQLNNSDFKPASLEYFQDIMGALLEYKRRHENQIRESFCLTTIGKKIWATLDFALASDSMVVLDGLEGRGKTEAVKAWCEAHLGQARFVSLKGIANKTTAFREISKALGIASSYARTSTDMQARIEDVLKRSGLLLVIDEAHFLFSQGWRIHTRPELIDWIDTAICNQGIGCALVTTPQFLVCMTRAADQVEWNFKQFRRRVSRWVK